MDPNAEKFLILNGALLVIVIVYMVWIRPAKGVRLRFQTRSKTPPAKKVYDKEFMSKLEHVDRVPFEKHLNVIFTYNGHEWDAYEVLGLPAGSSPQSVDEAYQKMRATVADDSKHFIDAAYRAIQQKPSHSS